MTYNFDPDRWYTLHREAIEARFERGEIDAEQRQQALDELERKLEEMLDRLDGTFEIPGMGSEGGG